MMLSFDADLTPTELAILQRLIRAMAAYRDAPPLGGPPKTVIASMLTAMVLHRHLSAAHATLAHSAMTPAGPMEGLLPGDTCERVRLALRAIGEADALVLRDLEARGITHA